MCIAIVKTKNGTITDEILTNCFENNPDGSGIAYTMNGKLEIIKGIFNKDRFIEAVRHAESVADNNIIIHCRISTSGLVDVDNSHPHVVNKDVVLIHNGILDIDVPKGSLKSDTRLFIEQYLSELPIDFMNNNQILKLIEDKIGKNNKFVFLNSKGDFKILNESAGYWIEGVWYSNTSYKDSYTYLTNKYYSYYEDEYYDEIYKHEYGMTRDEFLDVLLTNDKRLISDTRKFINMLTQDELNMLGSTPIYNVETEELRPDDGYTDLNEFYLYELDDSLEDLYEYRFYGYEMEEDIDQYV